MKEMTRSIVELERSVSRLETEKRFFRKTNKDFLSFSLETAMSGGRTTSKSLKSTPPVYLQFAFSFEKAIVKYSSTGVSDLVSSISDLKVKWKQGNGELKEM